MTIRNRSLGSYGNGWRAGALLMLGGTVAVAAGAPRESSLDAPLRINDLQWIGTHNAYHVAPDQAVFDAMRATGYRQSKAWPADRLARSLSFTHPTLRAQLDMGLRVFELDVHDDPGGGRYATPGFLRALDATVAAALPPVDPQGELREPGLKVFHAADIDVRSRCLRFIACLREIRDWSLAHPGHLPLFIQIETKEERPPPLANAYVPADPAPFDSPAWARLHTEIETVFARERLVRPADVQGRYPNVNAAVRARGWPPLDTLRGRIIFLLLDDPPKQDSYIAFTETSPEPILFVSRSPADPRTAWLIQPMPDPAKIRRWIRQGFLVYTRADADGDEPRSGAASRMQAALASGAQLIATDFPNEVSFDGRYQRCNPVAKHGNCSPASHLEIQAGPRNLE